MCARGFLKKRPARRSATTPLRRAPPFIHNGGPRDGQLPVIGEQPRGFAPVHRGRETPPCRGIWGGVSEKRIPLVRWFVPQESGVPRRKRQMAVENLLERPAIGRGHLPITQSRTAVAAFRRQEVSEYASRGPAANNDKIVITVRQP